MLLAAREAGTFERMVETVARILLANAEAALGEGVGRRDPPAPQSALLRADPACNLGAGNHLSGARIGTRAALHGDPPTTLSGCAIDLLGP